MLICHSLNTCHLFFLWFRWYKLLHSCNLCGKMCIYIYIVNLLQNCPNLKSCSGSRLWQVTIKLVFVMLLSASDSASVVERSMWHLELPGTIQLDEMEWGATRDPRVYARSRIENYCGVYIWPCQLCALGSGNFCLLATGNGCIPVKNTLDWSAVVFLCAR